MQSPCISPKGTTAQFPPSLSQGYLHVTMYSWSPFQHVFYVDEMLEFGGGGGVVLRQMHPSNKIVEAVHICTPL